MVGFNNAQFEISENAEVLAQSAAAWLLNLALQASDTFRVCLSGGSTPKRLYEILGTKYLAQFPWDKTHWYWGDERFVAMNDERSNYHMAMQAMLTPANVAVSHIHPILTASETVDIAAFRYQSHLQRIYGGNSFDAARPFFDVMLLGLGEDAHTASLFPNNKALKETENWVVAVPDGTPPPRITLTFPALNSTRHTAFLIAGEAKRTPLSRIMKKDKSAPAYHIQPIGDLHVFLDEAARIPEIA